MLCCNYCDRFQPEWEIVEGYPTGSCQFLCRNCLERVVLVELCWVRLDLVVGDAAKAMEALVGHPPPFWADESSLAPAARKWAGRPYDMRARQRFLALAGRSEQEVHCQMSFEEHAFNCLIMTRPESWMPIRMKDENGKVYLIDGEHRVTLALALEKETLRAVYS